MLSILVLAPALVAGLTQVSIEGFAFVPESVFVKPGDTVRWTNKDETAHTATSVNAAKGMWNSGNLSLNRSYQYVFQKEGIFDYNCTPHSGMLGWVTVSTVTSVRSAATAKPAATAPSDRSSRDLRGRALTPGIPQSTPLPVFQKP